MDPGLFSFTHPLWLWLAGGALLLTGEALTGSSWLLWPAVSAAVVGLLTAFGFDFPPQDQLALFAVLSVASTFASQGMIRRRRRLEPDPATSTTPMAACSGVQGEVVSVFENGRGRVLVDGERVARRT
jgi:membrane protein implicated in regulation of membrane protease activity